MSPDYAANLACWSGVNTVEWFTLADLTCNCQLKLVNFRKFHRNDRVHRKKQHASSINTILSLYPFINIRGQASLDDQLCPLYAFGSQINNSVHDTEHIDPFLLGGNKKRQTGITRLHDYFSPPNVLQLCVIIPFIGGSSHFAMGSIVF